MAPWEWDGLVGRWSGVQGGGADWYDLSGLHNHGTLTNMDPATDWAMTEKGWGIQVAEGSNEFVGNGDTRVLSSMTLAVLFRVDVIDLTTAGFLVSNYGGSSAAAYELVLTVPSGTKGALWWAHDRNFAVNQTSKTFAAGEVGLVVMRYDENTGTTIYNNGQVVDTDGNTGALRANTGVQFGDRFDSGSSGSSGITISSAWLWSRPLELSEIQHLHERPNDMITPRPTQVAVSGAAAVGGPFPWHLDRDLSGNMQSLSGGIGA